MMSLADFSKGTQLLPIALDGPVSPRMPAESHGWMREQFAHQVRPGDTIYYYCSEQWWDILMGSEGYILVRDGQIVDSMVVRMN